MEALQSSSVLRLLCSQSGAGSSDIKEKRYLRNGCWNGTFILSCKTLPITISFAKMFCWFSFDFITLGKVMPTNPQFSKWTKLPKQHAYFYVVFIHKKLVCQGHRVPFMFLPPQINNLKTQSYWIYWSLLACLNLQLSGLSLNTLWEPPPSSLPFKIWRNSLDIKLIGTLLKVGQTQKMLYFKGKGGLGGDPKVYSPTSRFNEFQAINWLPGDSPVVRTLFNYKPVPHSHKKIKHSKKLPYSLFLLHLSIVLLLLEHTLWLNKEIPMAI